MVGIKKVVHELKNLPNSSPKISEDTELSNQDNSQVNLLDLGTGTSVDSAPVNQTATECTVLQRTTLLIQGQTPQRIAGKTTQRLERIVKF